MSENAQFARKVEEAGLAFVGPSPEVIDSLGDKTKARALGRLFTFSNNLQFYIAIIAMKVGVPVVPGTPGPVATYKDGESFIQEYGFPGMSLG